MSFLQRLFSGQPRQRDRAPAPEQAPAATGPTLNVGSRGPDVERLQRALNAKGFDCGRADGVFGRKTAAALARFQQAHGMPAGSVVDGATWAALEQGGEESFLGDVDSGPASGLAQGARGDAVVALQQKLNAAGYSVGRADGAFGPKTAAALARFQADHDLEPGGTADSLTMALLDNVAREARASGAQAQSAERAPATVPARSGDNTGMEHAPWGVDAGAFEKSGLRSGVLQRALDAYDIAWGKRQTTSPIFTVIDYEIRSTERRLFVIDLSKQQLVRSEFMAHGVGSGVDGGYTNSRGETMNSPFDADEFSNRGGSHQSSLGMMRTAETYHGQFGYAMRLDGLESGINDAVRRRTIVMHGQQGVEDGNDANGRSAAWTKGCLGLDPAVTGDIIDTIKGGTLIFSYYPDPEYFQKSQYVKD